MAATKKIDFINGAYSQMRVSGLTVAPTASDRSLALNRLESMAYEFEGRNICTNYNFTEIPDPDDLTNVDLEFTQAFETNLALRLLPDFNIQAPPALIGQASQSLSFMSGRSAFNLLQQVQYPRRMPRGRANDRNWGSFTRYYQEGSNPPAECSTHNLFIGDINDFYEDYTSYLTDGETLSSAVLTADPGLSIVSQSVSSPRVNFRVEALNTEQTGNWQQIQIVVTTDSGRKLTRKVNFNVLDPQTIGTL